MIILLGIAHFGNAKKQKELRIFSLNIWGATYFNDLPYPSLSEPYDVATVKETYIEVYRITLILGFLLSEIENTVSKKLSYFVD